MDPVLIAQLIIAATNAATQIIPLLSAPDRDALTQALAALNNQVDQLHANRESVG